MYTVAPDEPYVEPEIFVTRTRLGVVDKFVYFESVLSRNRTYSDFLKNSES